MTLDRLFTDDRYQPLFAYRPLWEEARRRTARARSPYEATLLLERWFRRDGNFRYEELPPQGAGPPLVDFVELTRAGYCQHYAGAMALMLRMIGIPARVAVGFTAGTWKGGVWTVTDHQAHAWVEAWFAGHGWLAFDPTPGRGILSAVYTLASDSADAVAALGTGRFLDFNPGLTPPNAAGPVTPDAPAQGDGRPWWLVALLVIPLVALAAIVGAKRLRRSRRLRGGRRVSLQPACAPSSCPHSPTAVRSSIRMRRSASSDARRSVSWRSPWRRWCMRSPSRDSGHRSVLVRRRSRRAGSCAASSRSRGPASGPGFACGARSRCARSGPG